MKGSLDWLHPLVEFTQVNSQMRTDSHRPILKFLLLPNTLNPLTRVYLSLITLTNPKLLRLKILLLFRKCKWKHLPQLSKITPKILINSINDVLYDIHFIFLSQSLTIIHFIIFLSFHFTFKQTKYSPFLYFIQKYLFQWRILTPNYFCSFFQ